MSSSAGLLEWWHTALRSPYGIALRTNRPDAAAQRLYAARAAACDPALAEVSIVKSPTDAAVLWLMKKAPR